MVAGTEPHMNTLHDIRYALRAAMCELVRAFRFARHMRRGGNPDHIPF